MSTINLISLERAKLNLPSSTASDERTINAMIAAASDAIRKWCGRDFRLDRYDELHEGCWGDYLELRHYPIQSIESVRNAPEVVLEIQNTQTSTNQQARVTVTSTGLELLRVASGVTTRDTSVTWSAHATLQALATAINALGSGWSARVPSGFELWPSHDLYIPPGFGDVLQSQGALDCRGRWAGLLLHTSELGSYSWDARGWLTITDSVLGCVSGPGSWRIQYVAGYQEVPEAVQEACAGWTAILFEQSKRDPSLATLALPGSVSQTWTQPRMQPPVRIAALLAPFRRQLI
jgi:hypothetical protein